MKIGMNLLLWTDQAKPDEHLDLLQQIRQWGFDGVELAADNMHPADAAAFAPLLDELGLGRTTIAALDAQHADPASPDAVLRLNAVHTLKAAIDQTRLLGADLLCGPLFQGLGRFTGKAPQPDEWSRAVATIREVGEYAAAQGVRLALEPLNRFEMYMVNTLEEGVRFVKEVGLPSTVGLLADTHHGNIEERNVAAAWRQAAEHIFHVHISENDRGVPGSGHAVPQEIFEVLREIGYDGWQTIEAFSQQVPGLISRLHLWRSLSGHPDDAARLGVDFIKRSLAR